MSLRYATPFLLAGALALALAVGCGDDETPTGGGGGGGGNTLTISAGTYEITTEIRDCGTGALRSTSVGELVACSSEQADELFGYACAVERNGNALTASCTLTREVYGGCTETAQIDLSGTVTGDRYELYGTLAVSDDPADCWNGSFCDSLIIVLDRSGGTPSACTYADQNTVDLIVTGGPQAGSHELDAFGFGDESVGTFAFQFSASSGGIRVLPSSATGGESPNIYLSAQTTYLDPASLPATLPVVIQQFGERATAAGGNEVVLSYSEYSEGSSFMAESVAGGSFVVHEISADHIAGTLDVTVDGTEFSEQNPEGAPAQRTLRGGYFVTSNEGPGDNGPSAAPEATGVIARALARSMEQLHR